MLEAFDAEVRMERRAERERDRRLAKKSRPDAGTRVGSSGPSRELISNSADSSSENRKPKQDEVDQRDAEKVRQPFPLAPQFDDGDHDSRHVEEQRQREKEGEDHCRSIPAMTAPDDIADRHVQEANDQKVSEPTVLAGPVLSDVRPAHCVQPEVEFGQLGRRRCSQQEQRRPANGDRPQGQQLVVENLAKMRLEEE